MSQVTFVDAIDIVRGAPDSVKDGQRKRARPDVHVDLSGNEEGGRFALQKRFFLLKISICFAKTIFSAENLQISKIFRNFASKTTQRKRDATDM